MTNKVDKTYFHESFCDTLIRFSYKAKVSNCTEYILINVP